MTEQLPRWAFTFKIDDTEPRSVYMLHLTELIPPRVQPLSIATGARVDFLRVSVSDDSYESALQTAISARLDWEDTAR